MPSLFLLLIALLLAGDAPAVHVLRVGETEVRVVVHEGLRAGWSFLNVHDDEETSVEAARRVVEEAGGRIAELRHDGGRNVTFELDGVAYTFDPNRIFTDRGAAETLRAYGPFSEDALFETRRFANQLLALYRFEEQPVVATLHNNTPDGYSVLSYLPGAPYAGEARDVHVDRRRDPDDFYFVTDAALFERLKAKGYNVALQHEAPATDDGSLSVYAGRRGKPYVNVEAEHGHLREQAEMIRVLSASTSP